MSLSCTSLDLGGRVWQRGDQKDKNNARDVRGSTSVAFGSSVSDKGKRVGIGDRLLNGPGQDLIQDLIFWDTGFNDLSLVDRLPFFPYLSLHSEYLYHVWSSLRVSKLISWSVLNHNVQQPSMSLRTPQTSDVWFVRIVYDKDTPPFHNGHEDRLGKQKIVYYEKPQCSDPQYHLRGLHIIHSKEREEDQRL